MDAKVLYLPPSSPDFNPIEQVFVKLKADPRRAATRALSDLKAAIRSTFAKITPQACRNCSAATEYDTCDPT
ncbi:DDE superfamily endonuclease [Methylobacterium sp. B4]|nr:DDE superfamily endonuclease [Methylobacterium sp. B4]